MLVILEGTVESTGQCVQARTSFLPSEILWNRVFEPVQRSNLMSNGPTYSSSGFSNNKATIDFSRFNLTKPLEKLDGSNGELAEFLLKYLIMNNSGSSNRVAASDTAAYYHNDDCCERKKAFCHNTALLPDTSLLSRQSIAASNFLNRINLRRRTKVQAQPLQQQQLQQQRSRRASVPSRALVKFKVGGFSRNSTGNNATLVGAGGGVDSTFRYPTHKLSGTRKRTMSTVSSEAFEMPVTA